MSRKIKIEIDLSDQFLADVIITGVEGGINYWSQVVTYKHTEGPEHTAAEIIDEERNHLSIRPETIARGIERLYSNLGNNVDGTIMQYIRRAVQTDDAADIDSDAADVIIQAGLFNEIVYG